MSSTIRIAIRAIASSLGIERAFPLCTTPFVTAARKNAFPLFNAQWAGFHTPNRLATGTSRPRAESHSFSQYVDNAGWLL
jgi:hypothetical protein